MGILNICPRLSTRSEAPLIFLIFSRKDYTAKNSLPKEVYGAPEHLYTKLNPKRNFYKFLIL